jgi:serine/threonine protein kinase
VNPPRETFLDVATSVGDGAPLDWSVLGTSADLADDPALLCELEIIARIARAHRSVARDAMTPPDEGRRWSHLLIREELGAGSFATVYRAHDPHLQRDVALKIYNAAILPGDRLTRVFAEGRLLARVRHPNVVIVHGLEQRGDEVGLWLELIDGRTLADEVREGGALGFRETALVGQDLCRALAAVHLAGLVHGDVKPQNVMRERGGRIVLMDFGLGCDLQAPGAMAGGLRGTPLYMAPELFDGAPSSASSDIYSLGVSLFNLVSGTYPVSAGTREALEQSHRNGHRRLLRDVRPDLPDGFVQVIERACAADPSARYKTAGEMQAALSGALGMSAVLPQQKDVIKNHQRSVLTRKAGWLVAALLVAVASGAFLLKRIPGHIDTSSAVKATQTPPTTAVDPFQYQIRARFHRTLGSGSEALVAGARVAPGDRLFLLVDATKPVHVYIVNQDDRGESYLLFPLPGQKLSNPLSGGQTHRLPGSADWEVTSAGGREHFLIMASPEPLDALEKVFATLPRAEAGRPVAAVTLSREVVGQLRGIGGLAPLAPSGPATGLLKSAVTLGTDAESVKGPWIRQFTLENPAR